MADDLLAATVTATVTLTGSLPAGPSPAVADAVRELQTLSAFVDQARAGLAPPPDRRGRLAYGCFELALEHHTATAALAALAHWGSLFALQAALLESFVRGAWLARCADEEQLNAFEHGGLVGQDSVATLLPEVEHALGLLPRLRAQLGAASWDSYGQFARARLAHLERRGGASATASYPDAELVPALRLAAALGVLSGMELAAVAGYREIAQVLKQRAEQLATR